MTGLRQNSVPQLLFLAKSSTSVYTHLQGVAELAELGMGTEKKEYLQDMNPESPVDLWQA